MIGVIIGKLDKHGKECIFYIFYMFITYLFIF
jgi:hypothetical protein